LCASGFRGTPGSCYLACDSDADCGRDGYRCRTSSAGTKACVPGPTPLPDHVVGELCASDADCGGAAGTCSTALTGPGDGYCSQKCAVDADCGAGGICISGVNGITLSIGDCYRSCTPPGDCRTGFVCKSLSGASNDTRGACGPDRSAEAGAH
jgi:Cys-rich repeat protein